VNCNKEVKRLLREDGIFFCRTGLRDGLMKLVRRGDWSSPEHVFHYTRRALVGMLDAAGLEVCGIRPAFDSDFPYFLYDFSREGSSPAKRLARQVCGYSVLAWTLLGFPKDDVFITARPKTDVGRRHGNALFN
jgi:hypothetical protein